MLAQTSVTVPANDSVAVGYSCSFASGASGTNTATASWDSDAAQTPSGSASATADYAFAQPSELVNDSVQVYDNGNLLGPTDHSIQFSYPKSFPGTAGSLHHTRQHRHRQKQPSPARHLQHRHRRGVCGWE